MRKMSSAATTRHPCQTGRSRPRPSRSRAFPIAMRSTAIVSPVRQTVCPGSASNALEHGNADSEIAVRLQEARKRIGRANGHKLGDGQSSGGLQTIETDRDALRDVPDEVWRPAFDVDSVSAATVNVARRSAVRPFMAWPLRR